MKVKFMPMDVEYEIEFNETVLHLAQRQDIHIQSVCKGIPSCAECRVSLKQGEHHVLPPSSKELNLIGTAHYIDHSRLSCQLRCFGDVVVDLGEQLEKQDKVAKAPQGFANRKEGEESLAVKGNIIEEYKEDDDKSLTEEMNITKGPNNDDFYKDPKGSKKKAKRSRNRNNRNRKNKPRSAGGTGSSAEQKASSAEGSQSADGEKKSSNSNRKRRRRPRNRKPSNRGESS